VKWVFYPKKKKKNSKNFVYSFWWITILISKLLKIASLEAKIKRWKFWGRSQVLQLTLCDGSSLFIFPFNDWFLPMVFFGFKL